MNTPSNETEHSYQRLLREAMKNCEREAIHLVGSVQPFGVLLLLDENFIITRCSENAHALFAHDHQALIGRRLADLLGAECVEKITAIDGLGDWRNIAVVSFPLISAGRIMQHDASVSHNGKGWLVEIEFYSHSDDSLFHKLFVAIRDALWQLDAERDFALYTRQVVAQIRRLTGYDRVMMYQFDQNWDGEVIAESKVEQVGSYLGNHFPASDIPQQARTLYIKNLVRVIADVEAVPVAVSPRQGQHGGKPLDMTYSSYRHFSPLHLEYLRNMGVRASLTISLLQNGRLWGLIACHHMTSKYITLRERELFEFIGKTVSNKLSNLQNESRETSESKIRKLLDDFVYQLKGTNDIAQVLAMHEKEVLAVAEADGAIVAVEGQHYLLGKTPEPAQIRVLEARLAELEPQKVFYTDHLTTLHPPAAAYGESSCGLLIAPLEPQMDNYVLWFRKGVVRTLKWAGEPQKLLLDSERGARISPRTSFNTWLKTYRDKSRPWSLNEVDAAHSLSLAIIDVLSQRVLKRSEQHYRLLSESAADLIMRITPAGELVFVSAASEAVLGYMPSQLSGRRVEELLTPQDWGVLQSEIRQLLQDGQANTPVLQISRADGATIWLEARLSILRDDDKRMDILISARDVTQRHTYQLATEELHRRNAMLLDASADGLISVNADAHVVYVNERATELLGYPPEALLGKHCYEVLGLKRHCGGGYTRQDCPILNALDGGESYRSTSDLLSTGDGATLAVEYICTPLHDAGQQDGMAIVFHEFTDERRIHEQLKTTDIILEQTLEAVMVTDPLGTILTVNRAFTQITGYGAEEAIGSTPRLLKSGIHTTHFYQELWYSLQHDRHWTGEIWNRRKNGEIYPQWGSITAIVDEDDAIRNYVTVFSDVSTARQAEQDLHYMANHDALTGLMNRHAFTEHVRRSIGTAGESGHGMALLFVDLDHFKLINDSLGHTAGDEVIVVLATRLSGMIRNQDVLARWGGDEFVILLHDLTDNQYIGTKVQHMLNAVSRPMQVGSHELTPSFSIGVSLFPDDAATVDDLIRAADTAMYRAKDNGRNGFEFYTPQLAKLTREKFLVANELRRAVAAQQLALYYQPQVDSVSERLLGVEVLLRWKHPQHGLLSPTVFIPLAEELGLIEFLGEWVLRNACLQLSQWLDAGHQIPRVAVNISPLQLNDALPPLVSAVLQESGLSADNLELEITEGSLERSEAVKHLLEALHTMGVPLSIDDFGTGYSSLAHIKDFPVSCFKIDKSFVDGIPDDKQDVAIIRTILALGQSLEIGVLAEGVETTTQCEFLKQLGIHNIQGYLFARPMPAEEFIAWLVRKAAGG